MPIADSLLQFMRRQPLAASTLLGGAIGAPTGAIFSDVGEEGRGALQGAITGAVAGGGMGALGHNLIRRLPSPEQTLMMGAIGGGVIGGAAGRRHISPWVLEHLHSLQGDKEASVTEIEKQAAEKTAEEKMKSFSFGFLERVRLSGVPLEKVAEVAGCPVEKLEEATITCLDSKNAK